jgi:hypothetical protein
LTRQGRAKCPHPPRQPLTGCLRCPLRSSGEGGLGAGREGLRRRRAACQLRSPRSKRSQGLRRARAAGGPGARAPGAISEGEARSGGIFRPGSGLYASRPITLSQHHWDGSPARGVPGVRRQVAFRRTPSSAKSRPNSRVGSGKLELNNPLGACAPLRWSPCWSALPLRGTHVSSITSKVRVASGCLIVLPIAAPPGAPCAAT